MITLMVTLEKLVAGRPNPLRMLAAEIRASRVRLAQKPVLDLSGGKELVKKELVKIKPLEIDDPYTLKSFLYELQVLRNNLIRKGYGKLAGLRAEAILFYNNIFHHSDRGRAHYRTLLPERFLSFEERAERLDNDKRDVVLNGVLFFKMEK